MGGVLTNVLWTGTILILILCVAVFVTMLIYRAAARHIVPRSSFEYVGPPPESTKPQRPDALAGKTEAHDVKG